jgi:hypothetical protein
MNENKEYRQGLNTFTKSTRAKINAASTYFPKCCHLVGCGTPKSRTQSGVRSFTASRGHHLPCRYKECLPGAPRLS